MLRNADIYRELYGKGDIPVPEVRGNPLPPVKLASLVTPKHTPHRFCLWAGRSSKRGVAKITIPGRKVLVSSKRTAALPRKAAPKKKAVAAEKSTTQKKREPA